MGGDARSSYLVVDKHAIFEHSKGIQLLKKCGWRTGKCLGDKSTIHRLKLLLKRQDELLQNQSNTPNHLLFGKHILKTNSESINDTKSDNKMVSIYRPTIKTDAHGIGYNADTQMPKHCVTQSHDTFGPMKKKRKLMSSARHGLSALEEVEVGDDVYMDEHIEYDVVINDVGENDAVLMKDTDRKLMRNQNKLKYRKSDKIKDERVRSRDGRLPINGFVVSSIVDHFEYSLKESIRSQNLNKNKNNFKSDFDGFKKFKSNKMEIDKQFAHKFTNIDLSVGSFLCRQYDQKKRVN